MSPKNGPDLAFQVLDCPSLSKVKESMYPLASSFEPKPVKKFPIKIGNY